MSSGKFFSVEYTINVEFFPNEDFFFFLLPSQISFLKYSFKDLKEFNIQNIFIYLKKTTTTANVAKPYKI